MHGDHNHLVAHLPEVLDEVLEAVLVSGDVGEGRGLDEEGDAAGPGLGRGLVVAGGLRLQVRIGHPDGGRCGGAHKGGGVRFLILGDTAAKRRRWRRKERPW